MAEADEYGPGGHYEMGEDMARDDAHVRCPDCLIGVIVTGLGCTNCGLSWEDLEAAADLYDRLVVERNDG